MKRLALAALLGGLVVLAPGSAQDRYTHRAVLTDLKSSGADAKPAQPQHRTQYVVRNGDAETIAAAVAELYQGDAKVIAAPGNTILVGGTPATLAEVTALLEQLDRKPRTVEVEVKIVEATAKDGKLPTAEELIKDGKGQSITLTAVEGQPITSTIGGNKPVVRERAAPGGGGGGGFGGQPARGQVRSVSYQNLGTTVKLTARAAGDGLGLDLNVQDTRLRPADDDGEPAFDTTTLATKLSLTPGKPVVAQAVRADGKAGASVALVVVTARVVETRLAAK